MSDVYRVEAYDPSIDDGGLIMSAEESLYIFDTLEEAKEAIEQDFALTWPHLQFYVVQQVRVYGPCNSSTLTPVERKDQ